MPTWGRYLTITAGAMSAGKGGKLEVLGASKLALMVFPGDLDAMGHMNNGRYLTIQDLGRIDLLIRNGIMHAATKKKWTPVIGSAMIRFRKSLQPFDQFTLHTRILGWDAKWVYFHQQFIREETIYANSMVKGLFKGQTGNIPPKDVMLAAGGSEESPPLPEAVLLWNEADCALP